MKLNLLKTIFDNSITSSSLKNNELDLLIKNCEKHRIKQIFIDRMDMVKDQRANYREYAKKYTRYSLTRDLSILNEIDKLALLLESKKINFVFLKGAAFKKALYENSTLRDCRDVDLLVSATDVKPTLETLFENGYKYVVATESRNTQIDYEHSHQAPVLVSPNGQYIEIHYRITMEYKKCIISEDMLKEQKKHIAPDYLNLIHVTYHALILNRLNNGLMSLIDINYLLRDISRNEAIVAAEKYNLGEIVKHMMELYELNLFNKQFTQNKTDILHISNELIHAGEVLVGFKANTKSLSIFKKKYLGNREGKLDFFRINISFLSYILNKLFLHIISVIKNPYLWIKRNRLKKYLEKRG